jgi:uncharacterized protein YggE
VKKIILALCLMLLSLPAFADDVKPVGTTLDISAEAQVKATPDIATISTGVVTNAPRADQALDQNSAKMNALFKALKAAGIADKDIQTSGFNINPQYDYPQHSAPRITGYQANNTVSVVLHDMKKIGETLDTFVAAGSNQINGPQFSVENPDTVLDAARKEAFAKAKQRAQIYAAAAGLSIKRIVSITEGVENNSGPRPMMMMKAMAMGAGGGAESTPVAAGEMSLGVTVNVRFELAP